VVLTKAIGINEAGMIIALGHDPQDGDGHEHELPIRVLLLIPVGA
jgi:hypothetical protein